MSYRGAKEAAPACSVPSCTDDDTCEVWGRRICYPHFTDWMQGKAAKAGRPPTEIEWAAFLGWCSKQDDTGAAPQAPRERQVR